MGKGGSINISARSLQITNGAALIASTDGQGDAGNIQVQARDSVLLDGFGRDGFNSSIVSGVGSDAVGKGGDIGITTRFLYATNGGVLQASTDGQGDAGNITVEAANNVALDGVGSNGIRSAVLTDVGRGAVGRGSNFSITTGSLSVTNGAALFANTSGQGNAGNINIQARNNVLFDGRGGNSFSSGAFSDVTTDATGESGNISITTPSLSIINNAILNARTDGRGNAGSILIAANVVDVSAGGQIETTTSSGNKAGSITLNVSDRLTLSGPNTGLFANTKPGSSGNGGRIFIDPRTVIIQDGAKIAVDSQGSGIGGNINIQAGRLELRDRATITATTASAQCGKVAKSLLAQARLKPGAMAATFASMPNLSLECYRRIATSPPMLLPEMVAKLILRLRASMAYSFNPNSHPSATSPPVPNLDSTALSSSIAQMSIPVED